MTRGRTYVALVAALVVFASPIISIFAAVRISDNRARQIVAAQERAQAEAQAAARAESRRLTCEFFTLNLDAYDETPPVTPVGKNLRENYLKFYRLSGCHPPRQ